MKVDDEVVQSLASTPRKIVVTSCGYRCNATGVHWNPIHTCPPFDLLHEEGDKALEGNRYSWSSLVVVTCYVCR